MRTTTLDEPALPDEARCDVFVHDFLPIERNYVSLALRVHTEGTGIVERAVANGRLESHCVVEVGAPRDRDDLVVLPLRIRTEDPYAPFVVLEADLQLAPLAPGWAHLSLSGTFERRGHDLGRHVDRLVDQRRTEAYLRMLLLDVAGELGRPTAVASRIAHPEGLSV
jgi:hypothetical protein